MSEALAEDALSLPIGPHLSEEQVGFVIQMLKDVVF